MVLTLGQEAETFRAWEKKVPVPDELKSKTVFQLMQIGIKSAEEIFAAGGSLENVFNVLEKFGIVYQMNNVTTGESAFINLAYHLKKAGYWTYRFFLTPPRSMLFERVVGITTPAPTVEPEPISEPIPEITVEEPTKAAPEADAEPVVEPVLVPVLAPAPAPAPAPRQVAPAPRPTAPAPAKAPAVATAKMALSRPKGVPGWAMALAAIVGYVFFLRK